MPSENVFRVLLQFSNGTASVLMGEGELKLMQENPDNKDKIISVEPAGSVCYSLTTSCEQTE